MKILTIISGKYRFSFIFFFAALYSFNCCLQVKADSIIVKEKSEISLPKDMLISSKVDQSKDSIIRIEISNIPKENVWLEILKIVSATTIGGLIVWFFSYRNQKKLILKENFERNLFAMMENQNNILNEIETSVRSYEDRTKVIEIKKRQFFLFGRIFMVNLYSFLLTDQIQVRYKRKLNYDFTDNDNFDEIHKNSFVRGRAKTDKEKEQLGEWVYNFFFEKFYDVYGHYMRHFYRILLFIENEEKNIKKFGSVKFYTDLIQARMSTSELFVLFYNGLKYKTAHRLVKKYFLIENLRVDLLMDKSHRIIYESENCRMKEE